MTSPIEIFFCYAHEDEVLLKQLQAHLRPLQREGLIDTWYDRDISAGRVWESDIKQHLNSAQIILLLVSPDFMNSDYCYGKEMKQALERHERKEARVIPIILRPIYWQVSPLRKLQALPTDAKPVTSPKWHNLDEAFFDVAEGIRTVTEQLSTPPPIHFLESEIEEEPEINIEDFEGLDFFPPLSSSQKVTTSIDEIEDLEVRVNSPGLLQQSEKQEIFDLQKLIFIGAVVACILLFTSFFVTVLTLYAVLLAILIFGFALYQVAVLEHWVWFLAILILSPFIGFVYYVTDPTSPTLKRYWFIGLILLSSLAVIVYGRFGPKDKPVYMFSYTKLKHLVFFISFTGLVFLIFGSLSFSGVLPNFQFCLYASAGFIFAGYIFTIIQLIRLKQYNLFNTSIIAPIVFISVFILGFTSGEIFYLFVFALVGIAYGIRGPTSVPRKPLRKKPVNTPRSQKRKG